jgi:hypothetical protein
MLLPLLSVRESFVFHSLEARPIEKALSLPAAMKATRHAGHAASALPLHLVVQSDNTMHPGAAARGSHLGETVAVG